ncbi:MAG: hypothetical protein AB7O78_02025 [Thermoleophilia bacterium]
MAVLDSIAKQANRLASDVQMSLRRARVEGERRLLQRQHRAALEELGERTYELVRAGKVPEEPLATEIAAVESKLMEIEAKVAEIDSLRTDDEADAGPADDDQPTATTPTDPSRAAFPMVGGDAPPPGPGPGWEAAEKFFGKPPEGD